MFSWIVKRFGGGLVLKAHRLSYHSTLGSRVRKKKKDVHLFSLQLLLNLEVQEKEEREREREREGEGRDREGKRGNERERQREREREREWHPHSLWVPSRSWALSGNASSFVLWLPGLCVCVCLR
jgi:hypothetical protein